MKKENIYKPSEKVLQNLADVLVKYALNSGEGVKKNEVVYLIMNENSKKMLLPMQKAILTSGAHMILCYLPKYLERDRDETRQFYEIANEEQLNFFPREYIKARINSIDHVAMLLSVSDHNYYQGLDTSRISQRSRVWKEYMNLRSDKEYAGKLTWTLTDYPTKQMADSAGLTLEEYWEQVISACYLDMDDPISMHKSIAKDIGELISKLNALEIEKINIRGKDCDLTVGLNSSNIFVGGTGRNIPSFEIFTSPDYRMTNGWINFNQPLYRNGNVIKGIKLKFKDGVVVEYSSDSNENALKSMLETDEGSRRVGEFSLTDKRFSRINKIMANTLYDENFGGEFGNTHIALGQSYKDAILDQAKYSEAELVNMGFNNSAIHTDIISTSNREAIATLRNGKQILLYENGEFKI